MSFLPPTVPQRVPAPFLEPGLWHRESQPSCARQQLCTLRTPNGAWSGFRPLAEPVLANSWLCAPSPGWQPLPSRCPGPASWQSYCRRASPRARVDDGRTDSWTNPSTGFPPTVPPPQVWLRFHLLDPRRETKLTFFSKSSPGMLKMLDDLFPHISCDSKR